MSELCGDCIVWGMQRESLGLQELGGGVLQGRYVLERETGLIPGFPWTCFASGGITAALELDVLLGKSLSNEKQTK